MTYLWFIVVAVGAYLIGSINYSIMLSEVFAGSDIRSKGSGNAGSTNMLRSFGWKAGVLTLMCDFMKAFVATLSAWAIFKMYLPDYVRLATATAGLFCAIGHCFPLYFNFKGGKGVAVGAIMILMTDWRCFMVAIAVFLLLVLTTRYISLGSTMAGVSYPISFALIIGLNNLNDILTFILAITLAVMVLILHRQNFARLFKGKENKFSFKSKK